MRERVYINKPSCSIGACIGKARRYIPTIRVVPNLDPTIRDSAKHWNSYEEGVSVEGLDRHSADSNLKCKTLGFNDQGCANSGATRSGVRSHPFSLFAQACLPTLDNFCGDSQGHLTRNRQGGRISTDKDYDPATGRLTQIQAQVDGQAAGSVLSQSYSYDSKSQLTAKSDANTGCRKAMTTLPPSLHVQ